MADLITLAEAKLHLRVDHSDEDTAIQAMINAAVAATADYLNMDAEDLDSEAPAPVKSAALLLIGDLYEHREAQAERALFHNMTYVRLLNPYRAMEA